MKTNIQTRRGFTLVELLVVIVIIASLAGLTAPMVIRQRKKADQTEATNNIRQIGFAMLEFDSDYGSYPGVASLPQLDTGADVLASGTSTSNDFFRQFFMAGLTTSEQMFYCKAAGTIKPDGVVSSAAEALKTGECGFGYAWDGAEAFNSSGNPARPIIMAPLSDGATTFAFDPAPFDKNAVLLRGDNSVTSAKITNIDPTTGGQVNAPGGSTNLFDNTGDTVWGANVTPTLAPPDQL